MARRTRRLRELVSARKRARREHRDDDVTRRASLQPHGPQYLRHIVRDLHQPPPHTPPTSTFSIPSRFTSLHAASPSVTARLDALRTNRNIQSRSSPRYAFTTRPLVASRRCFHSGPLVPNVQPTRTTSRIRPRPRPPAVLAVLSSSSSSSRFPPFPPFPPPLSSSYSFRPHKISAAFAMTTHPRLYPTNVTGRFPCWRLRSAFASSIPASAARDSTTDHGESMNDAVFNNATGHATAAAIDANAVCDWTRARRVDSQIHQSVRVMIGLDRRYIR